jgi:hypothetical protein
MDYKVVPFRAALSSGQNAGDAAGQVQSLISEQATQGWEFVSCGNIDTTIAGSDGCFGIGAKPPVSTSVLVLVFKK